MVASYVAGAESWTALSVPGFHPLAIMLWGRGPIEGIQVARLVMWELLSVRAVVIYQPV